MISPGNKKNRPGVRAVGLFPLFRCFLVLPVPQPEPIRPNANLVLNRNKNQDKTNNKDEEGIHFEVGFLPEIRYWQEYTGILGVCQVAIFTSFHNMVFGVKFSTG